MTEIRRPNWEDNFIWTEAVWDAAFRAMLAELTYAQAWAMFHETDSGSGVVGGLEWSTPSGITTRIARGWAIVYDAAIVAPGPKWKFVYLGASQDVAHSARHATLDRVDCVSLSYALTEDTSEVLGRPSPATPAATNTQVGSVATVVVTAGTAHASPWANKATCPAGNLLLYYVLVPDTAEGTAPTAIDARVFAPGPSNRPVSKPVTWRVGVSDTLVQIAEVYARKESVGGATSWNSILGWDMTRDLPVFTRGLGAAGESTGDHYPMVIPGGRTWWRSVPFIGIQLDLGANPMTAIHGTAALSLTRIGATAITYQHTIPIAADVRGLEVVAAKMRYKCTTAFDPTWNEKVVDLFHVAADGTSTLVGSATLTLSGVHGSVQTITFSSLATPVIAEGDTLFAQLRLASTASGTAVGVVLLYGVDVQFEEGQA